MPHRKEEMKSATINFISMKFETDEMEEVSQVSYQIHIKNWSCE